MNVVNSHWTPGVLSRNSLVFIIPVLFLFFCFNTASSEEITVTTYYPSPNGTYDALSVKRFSVGDTNADGSINASDVSATDGYLLVADKLGIGTTAPKADLNTAAGISIGSGGGVSTTEGERRSLQLLTDTDYGGVYDAHSGYLMYSTMPGGWGTAQLNFAVSTNWGVYNTASPVLLMSSSGIGIGTTDPLAKLQVTKTGNSLTSSSLTNDDLIVDDADAVVGVYSSNAGSWGSALVLGETNSGTFQDKWGIARLTSTYNSDLTFTYGTNVNYSSNTRMVTLATSGDVGIGVTSPAAKLDVNGDIHARSPLTWEVHYDDVAPNTIATSSTSWTTMSGMSLSFTMPAAGKVFVIFSAGMCGNQTAATRGYWRMLLDGSAVSSTMKYNTDAWELDTVELHRVLSVSAGSHTVEIQWKTNSGTLNCPHVGTSGDVGQRTLTVFPLN